jgi:Sulfotransferase family
MILLACTRANIYSKWGIMLTAAHALEFAVKATGFEDFGPDGYQEGIERTLDAFESAPITPNAREAAGLRLIVDLCTRLRIEQWYKEHPEISNLPIEGPFLVCGLPRTGTTATVGMLALDARFRFLRTWEAVRPVPPPRIADEFNDPRAIAARQAARNYSKPTQHIHDPDGPEEDLALLAGLNMHAYHGRYPMPQSFLDWWIREDFGSTYAYHRRVLRLLESERPPHLWLLKAPVHLFKLETFAAEYPGARFIMTHRDPAKVIPSVSSLFFTMHSEHCAPGALNKLTFGPALLAFWQQGMQRALEARQRIGEHRFIDLWNDEVAGQPIETFRKLYEWLDFEAGPELNAKLEDYRRKHAPEGAGKHRYSAEEYGLTGQQIRAAFSDYVERFHL